MEKIRTVCQLVLLEHPSGRHAVGFDTVQPNRKEAEYLKIVLSDVKECNFENREKGLIVDMFDYILKNKCMEVEE